MKYCGKRYPTIIFFPGQGECAYPGSAREFFERLQVTNYNVFIVTINDSQGGALDTSRWIKPVQQINTIILRYIKAKQISSEIIVDGFSFGGYAATLFAMQHDENITIK